MSAADLHDAEMHEAMARMADAENYNAWLVDRARPHLGRRVLDLGAGAGTLTAEFARDAERVVALEPDRGFVEVLRRRFDGASNVEIVHGGVDALGSPPLTGLDSVVCFNVLEHIADDRGTLDRIRATLRPGGALLLLVPAHRFLFGEMDRIGGHERRYELRPLARLLEDGGFAVADIRHVNPLGAVGWLVSARLLRRPHIPRGPLAVYDRVVPLLRALDALRLPFGLSIWAVARRAD